MYQSTTYPPGTVVVIGNEGDDVKVDIHLGRRRPTDEQLAEALGAVVEAPCACCGGWGRVCDCHIGSYQRHCSEARPCHACGGDAEVPRPTVRYALPDLPEPDPNSLDRRVARHLRSGHNVLMKGAGKDGGDLLLTPEHPEGIDPATAELDAIDAANARTDEDGEPPLQCGSCHWAKPAVEGGACSDPGRRTTLDGLCDAWESRDKGPLIACETCAHEGDEECADACKLTPRAEYGWEQKAEAPTHLETAIKGGSPVY